MWLCLRCSLTYAAVRSSSCISVATCSSDRQVTNYKHVKAGMYLQTFIVLFNWWLLFYSGPCSVVIYIHIWSFVFLCQWKVLLSFSFLFSFFFLASSVWLLLFLFMFTGSHAKEKAPSLLGLCLSILGKHLEDIIDDICELASLFPTNIRVGWNLCLEPLAYVSCV